MINVITIWLKRKKETCDLIFVITVWSLLTVVNIVLVNGVDSAEYEANRDVKEMSTKMKGIIK